MTRADEIVLSRAQYDELASLVRTTHVVVRILVRRMADACSEPCIDCADFRAQINARMLALDEAMGRLRGTINANDPGETEQAGS